MLNRIIISILGIPLLAYLYYSGGIPLLIFVNLIIAVGLFEFYTMVENSGKKVYKTLGIIFGMMIPNILFFDVPLQNSEVLIILSMILMIMRVLRNETENSSSEIGVTLLGIVYVSIFFSHMLLISKFPNGGKLILVIQVLVWVCDSFAYFTGVKFGRKFFKQGFSQISPKKSVEGAIGGTFCTILVLYLINNFFNVFPTEISTLAIIFIGIIISLTVQVGDLVESMFKREFKIKDSGRILGEHGGILDRFDSLIFLLPAVYYTLKYLIL
ncbi:MAG: phosphatidate cytidylyltransferase [Fusobacteriaceae bacterium]